MKDKIFGVLQRVGRSFMLPIAILPVAGLLLGIGSSFTNATMIETYGLQAILGEGTVLNGLLNIGFYLVLIHGISMNYIPVRICHTITYVLTRLRNGCLPEYPHRTGK